MIRIKLLILFLIFTFVNVHANKLDSLKKVLPNQKDTVLLKNYLKLGIALYNNGELDSSFKYFNKGYQESVKLNNNKFICDFLLRLGLIQREQGVYNKASEYYYKAMEIAEKYNFKKQSASGNNGIGVLSAIQKDYDKARIYYNKSLELYKELDNQGGQSSIYNNIGLSYLDQKNNSLALKYFLKAFEISKKLNDDNGIAINSENIGLIYHELHDYATAFIYYKKALAIWNQREDENSISITLGYIGNNFMAQSKYEIAKDTLLRAFRLAKKVNSLSSARDHAFSLAKAYEKLNDFGNSLNYFKIGKELTDSLQNEEKTKEITEIQLNYAFNKIKVQDSIKHQMEVQVKENQLKAEKNYKYIVTAILIVISILLFYVFKNYKEKTKAHSVISDQKNLLEQKQREILDSMIYARRIQNALLTHKEFIDENIKDRFVLLKPKDIVSGDFYWAASVNSAAGKLLYLAVCDSTGHGVPGAFMSLLNMGFLSEAVIERQIKNPAEVLNFVRQKLVETISADGQQDGFDGILLCINSKTKTIKYAAANNAPVMVTNSNLSILTYDKMPVGIGVKNESFKNYEINYNSGDILYLYTDGYADQFGGLKGKKFKYKQLNELLLKNSIKEMAEQEKILNNTLENWRGNLEQVDDVCVIGIKL